MIYRPKLIICGASAYAREWNYARLRKVGCVLCGFFLFFRRTRWHSETECVKLER